MDNWFNVLCLLALILLNGLFAMSEIALVTSRKARLQIRIDDGNSGAKVALKLNEEPTRALSAIQVGITSIGILSGIVGEAALATPVAVWLTEQFGVEVNTARAVGLILVVVLVTYFSIVLGELVPKRLGQMNPEGVACRIAPPINFLAVLMAPFVKLLSVSTDLLLRLTGKQNVEENAVTEEEIHQMVVEGSEAGTIEVQERDMVRKQHRALLLDRLRAIAPQNAAYHLPEPVLRMAIEKRRLTRFDRRKRAENQNPGILVEYRCNRVRYLLHHRLAISTSTLSSFVAHEQTKRIAS